MTTERNPAESEIANRIKIYLNGSLELSATELARLRSAREQALQRQRVGSSVLIPAWAGNMLGRTLHSPTATRFALPMAAVVLGLIAVQQWQQPTQSDRDAARATAEIEEIDAALLKSDLPIDAYLNSDFHSWLKHTSE